MIATSATALAVLGACAAPALAEPPARVGRISSLEGQVTVLAEGEANAALLNWPITSANHIATGRGARAEFRVGAAAVRLDGDSDLEVSQLDDDSLHLYLHYGSASVRIRDNELVRDFELSTPQARVTLSEPGWLRVDAGRSADSSVVSVFAGMAQVDGAGNTVSLRSGHRVEVGNEELRTGAARRDAFDNWAEARERRDQAGPASRYLPAEVTGAEELDQYGSWQDSNDYGPLWTPRVVALDWAPYRDGRWIWLAPWGWTWVDNAPWGYAPSHYGRWVMLNRRWCWAPGRVVGRPVWAPALVGWVGGDQLTVTFGGSVGKHRGPGLGWFPLSPRDSYVPPYRVSVDQERRLSWRHDGRGGNSKEPRRDHRDGVTVLPRDQFDGHRVVPVGKGPKVIMSTPLMVNAPLVGAPAAPARVLDTRHLDQPARNDGRDPGREPGRGDRSVRSDRLDHVERGERDERDGHNGRNNLSGHSPRSAVPATSAMPPATPATSATSATSAAVAPLQTSPPQSGKQLLDTRREPRPGPAVLVAPAVPGMLGETPPSPHERPGRRNDEPRHGRGQEVEPRASQAPRNQSPQVPPQVQAPVQVAQPAQPAQQIAPVQPSRPAAVVAQPPSMPPVHQAPAPQVHQAPTPPVQAAPARDAGRQAGEQPGRKEANDKRREEGREARERGDNRNQSSR
ncbi:hypothetical protein H7U20_24610 [Rugamonas sp. CCM 8940]|nr:hypothetical protein [Rugamonas sp. CCM 8940]